MIDKEAPLPNLGAVNYKDAKGETCPMYLLDVQATMTLITGYDAAPSLEPMLVQGRLPSILREAQPFRNPPSPASNVSMRDNSNRLKVEDVACSGNTHAPLPTIHRLGIVHRPPLPPAPCAGPSDGATGLPNFGEISLCALARSIGRLNFEESSLCKTMSTEQVRREVRAPYARGQPMNIVLTDFQSQGHPMWQ